MGEQERSPELNAITSAMASFSQLIDRRLDAFAQTMSQQSGSRVEEAVRKAKRETFVCKRKRNQRQLDHCVNVLEKLEETSSLLGDNAIESAKRKLEEGSQVIQKRIKAIKLAD